MVLINISRMLASCVSGTSGRKTLDGSDEDKELDSYEDEDLGSDDSLETV